MLSPPPSSELASQQALHSLYHQHHAWLKIWLRKRLSCAESAADLAQDTFVRVLANRQTQELREPRAYLSSIARSLMIDGFRRRALEKSYLETLASMPEQLEISPETRVLILETLVEIDSMLDNLGARGREIFLLAQLDGLSQVEIGRRLGLSTNTVRKHLVRALTQCMLLIED
ncbi:sigma-70 family RNA polymerase sigma factor [Pseudomonas sp.]|uniref:sigma-70 family RNA polymerase sigma factor n=1 Tax=Pseudomonas sp. TaxID=306 RepID=UPI003A96C22E